MRSKSQTAWEAAAKCATLAQEADNPQEREHYARLRDAWTTLARRCEPFDFPDVTEPRPRLGYKFKTLVSLSHSYTGLHIRPATGVMGI